MHYEEIRHICCTSQPAAGAAAGSHQLVPADPASRGANQLPARPTQLVGPLAPPQLVATSYLPAAPQPAGLVARNATSTFSDTRIGMEERLRDILRDSIESEIDLTPRSPIEIFITFKVANRDTYQTKFKTYYDDNNNSFYIKNPCIDVHKRYYEENSAMIESKIEANSPRVGCFTPTLKTKPGEYNATDVLQVLKTKLALILRHNIRPESIDYPIQILDCAAKGWVRITPFKVVRGEEPLYWKYGYKTAGMEKLMAAVREAEFGTIKDYPLYDAEYYGVHADQEDVPTLGKIIEEALEGLPEDNKKVVDIMREISSEQEAAINEANTIEMEGGMDIVKVVLREKLERDGVDEEEIDRRLADYARMMGMIQPNMCTSDPAILSDSVLNCIGQTIGMYRDVKDDDVEDDPNLVNESLGMLDKDTSIYNMILDEDSDEWKQWNRFIEILRIDIPHLDIHIPAPAEEEPPVPSAGHRRRRTEAGARTVRGRVGGGRRSRRRTRRRGTRGRRRRQISRATVTRRK